MGDKSPKNKQREKSQKSAAKAQTRSDQAKRQAAFATPQDQERKKK